MDYWILLENGAPLLKTEKINGVLTNCIPYSFEEAQSYKESLYPNSKLINISEEIRQQGIEIGESHIFEQRQNIFHIWNTQFLDNNINGFSMPKYVCDNDSYLNELSSLFEKYKNEVQKIAFKHEENLVEDVTSNCDMLLQALNIYLDGDKNKAKTIISSLIKKYIDNTFWVSDLDKSYAFRGNAPFVDLHSEGYKKIYANMMCGDIDFYRARYGDVAKDKKQFLHIPYSLLNKVTEQRFSLKEQPCLYLGTSSYVCWTECRKPELENFYIAGFRANELGKKLKIFNLVASEPLANGIYSKGNDKEFNKELQNSMLKLLPIVFATSFSVNNEYRQEKYEYIIPQLIMQALSELNIDGVAYLSKQGKNDFQYPQGVNLAIPVLDISYDKEYGEVCNKFIITEPKGFKEYLESQTQSKSYINRAFSDYIITEKYNRDFQQYSKVDNVISGEKYKVYDNKI